MWTYLPTVVVLATLASGQSSPRSGDELVSTVLDNCNEMDCVKHNVLGYLDNLLHVQSDVGSIKNVDAAIYKRVAKVLKTHEFRFKVPEVLLEGTEIVYNPKSGLDLEVKSTDNESRGLLKKKLLLPILLLLKLKMKLLQPLVNILLLLKTTKALILSKLSILIVIGFIAYQLLGKSGMPMPMMMMPPAEPPASLYGPPSSSPPPAPLNSYDPSWEPANGGPYQRMYSVNSDPQNMAYSAYYPGSSSSPSTNRP